ncbi:MAG: hypothetical protein B6A08_09035 [Sorangiineae bacterium NIC37A_2]|nr:MAG: hypothetical protein B6A08_09035 [Sorangiineae bacterium NIC37A_2]
MYALSLTGCGLLDQGDDQQRADGNYWRFGAQVAFRDDSPGGLPTRLTGGSNLTHSSSIIRRENRYFLDVPACTNEIPLTLNEDFSEVFTAHREQCAPTEAAKALGYTERFYTALHIDLKRRSLANRECGTSVDGSVGCAQATGVFVPFEGEGSGGGGGASNGRLDPKLANFSDSVRAWRFDNESDAALMRQCAALDETGEACDPDSRSIRSIRISGTVHEMKDGRYYLAGYDCYVENGYDGEPLRCGQSFDGGEDVGIPQAWIYRFELNGTDLHFKAEMRGKDYTYYLIVDAPLVDP